MKELDAMSGNEFDLNLKLFHAASDGKLAAVKRLLRQGASLDFRFEDEDTPLHMAVQSGNYQLVKFIIDEAGRCDLMCEDAAFGEYSQNMFLDAESEFYGTPLRMAVDECNSRIALLLLRHGALPIINGAEGMSALHVAASQGDAAFIEKVINAPHMNYQAHPESDELEFLNLGSDGSDYEGATPLHFAICNRHISVVEMLINAGADVDAVDRQNRTPLHYAISSDSAGEYYWQASPRNRRDLKTRKTMVMTLLAASASVEARDDDLRTPLHHAAFLGAFRIVRLLLEAGASTSARSSVGKRAIDEARQKKNRPTVLLLQTWKRKKKHK